MFRATSCFIIITVKQLASPINHVTEAEYTYRLKKPIIPLVLQPGYDPDGWLGALVGTRLHYDFSKDEYIPTEMPKLIRELGHRAKLPKRVVAASDYYRDSSLDGKICRVFFVEI